MYKDIVIISAIRTPFGRYCGSLREYDYYDLGALPMKEVLARVAVPGDEVDEVFWGVGDTSVCKDVNTPVAARQTLITVRIRPNVSRIKYACNVAAFPSIAGMGRAYLFLSQPA